MDYQHDWLNEFSANIQVGDFIAYDEYHDVKMMILVHLADII